MATTAPKRKNPARPAGAGSNTSLMIYMLALVAGTWGLLRHGLHVELTPFLARGITATGAEWVMVLLIALSVLSLTVVFERWLYYSRRAVDVTSARHQLKALLDRDEVDEALAFAETLPGMEGAVLVACVRALPAGESAMEEEMLAALAQERLKYDKNLSVLGTLGNNAPFIGLFGTVLGIIKAFLDLAADVTGGASAVMGGISEALVATAIGLLVAIPSVVAFNALKARVKAIVSNTETLARTVMAHAKSTARHAAGEDGGGL